MGYIAQLMGWENPAVSGYYKNAKEFYQPAAGSNPVKPHIHARDGYGGIACERVTSLTARTPKQWVFTMLGVFAAGVGVFVAIALVKKDEKFRAEVIKPLKKLMLGTVL